MIFKSHEYAREGTFKSAILNAIIAAKRNNGNPFFGSNFDFEEYGVFANMVFIHLAEGFPGNVEWVIRIHEPGHFEDEIGFVEEPDKIIHAIENNESFMRFFVPNIGYDMRGEFMEKHKDVLANWIKTSLRSRCSNKEFRIKHLGEALEYYTSFMIDLKSQFTLADIMHWYDRTIGIFR